MKRTYQIVASLALLVSALAPNLEAAEAVKEEVQKKTESYINKEKKYSIDYPAEWQKKDIPKLDLVLFVTSGDSNVQAHASMNIVSEVVGPTVTLDQFYSESVSNLTGQLKEVTVENSGTTTLNGVPSKWILYTHTMQGIKFRVLQYFAVAQDTVYLVTFSATADDFEKYRPDFEKIVFSFRTLSNTEKKSS